MKTVSCDNHLVIRSGAWERPDAATSRALGLWYIWWRVWPRLGWPHRRKFHIRRWFRHIADVVYNADFQCLILAQQKTHQSNPYACMHARTHTHTRLFYGPLGFLDFVRDYPGESTGLSRIEQGLTSHQTHYRSYRGWVFMGQITQPTVSKHWRKIGPKD